MKTPALRPDQFAFRETVTFGKDNPWPHGVWNALARAAGVRAKAQSVDALPLHPTRLSGTFEVGANVLAVRSFPGTGQVVGLSFAAFRAKDGALAGWSYDHTGESSQPTQFFAGEKVVLDVKWLRKLQREGKNLRAGGAEPEMRHDADVTHLAFSRDGKRLVSLGNDHVLRAWDVATGRAAWKAKLHKFACGLSVGRERVLVGGGPTTRTFDLATGAPLAKLKTNLGLDTLALLDDEWALAGHDTVGLWDVATGKQLKKSKPLAGYLSDIAANGNTIVVIDDSDEVRAFDRELVQKSALAVPGAYACAATENGVFVWVDVGKEQTLRQIDFARRTTKSIARGEGIDLAADGSLALVRAKKKCLVVAARSGETVASIDAHASRSAIDPSSGRAALAEGATIRFAKF